MRRGFVVVAAMGLALAAGRAVPSQADPADATARFADYPKEPVKSHVATVKVEVPQALLAKKDVWIGVRPVKYPTSFFKQGAKITTPTATRIVQVGLPGVPEEADFLVLLLACPRGALDKSGTEVLEADEIRLMVETVDTVMIHRSK